MAGNSSEHGRPPGSSHCDRVGDLPTASSHRPRPRTRALRGGTRHHQTPAPGATASVHRRERDVAALREVGSCPASRPVPYWDTLPAGVHSCVPGGLVRDAPWTGGPLPARNRSLHPTAGLDGVSTTLPGMPPATFLAQRRGPSDRVPTLPTTGRRRSVSIRRASSVSCSPFGSTTKSRLFTSVRSAL